MTLRILMMADVPPDPNRGAAGTEVQTARALREAGHEVDTLWAADLGRRIQHGNLHLLLELPRAYERAALRALEAKRYDVLHVNQPHGFRAARAVHRRHPGVAFLHRSHGFARENSACATGEPFPEVENRQVPFRRYHKRRAAAHDRSLFYGHHPREEQRAGLHHARCAPLPDDDVTGGEHIAQRDLTSRDRARDDVEAEWARGCRLQERALGR